MPNRYKNIDFKKSLAYQFPDIAKEWDYAKNGDLTPERVTPGMHKKVYWKCPICKQSYSSLICNRTAPSRQNKKTNKCPVCLGRKIIPGFNSLKALYPEIVAKEWDYEKNTVDPDTIPPHRNSANGKYWWKCPNGHSYDASVNNKVSGNGGNCPYCSHEKLSPENSLTAKKPDLAKEWDYEKNYPETPETVFASSSRYVFWICSKCKHKWKASIRNRSQKNTGCPECRKGTHTSFSELAIFYYIQEFFPEATNRAEIKGFELDVYIESIHVGIEYDGEYFHSSKEKYLKDCKKNEALKSAGLYLIRIREKGCYPMNADNCKIYTVPSNDYLHLQLTATIKDILLFLSDKYSINYRKPIDINVKRDQNIIQKDVNNVPYEKSFAAFNKKREEEGKPLKAKWDYKANAPLTPEMVKPMSEKSVHWICINNSSHKWEATVKNISLGYGCNICSKRRRYTTEEWIEAAKKKHGNKYDYSKTEYINARTKVIIICKKHGEFLQNPSEHLQGKGCKYCAHQTFHPSESLAVLRPDIAAEWDYKLNKDTGITPETIGIDYKRKFYWHCNNGKRHSYTATIGYRVKRNSGCAVCHGKQVDHTTSVEFLRPDLAAEWCKENKYLPSEVTLGSEKKILWKCPNPDHKPYLATVYSRAKMNSGCPECSGNIKSSLTYQKDLRQKFPNIELLSEYKKSSERVKCKCLICGREWNPFPYNLLNTGCSKCHNKK